MNLLNTLLTILGWIVAGIVLWAVLPVLQRLFELAQYVHHLWP